MDVVGLAFAVFGHLLASVLYIWRRIPFSPSGVSDVVDRSSILENKDQLRQLWERRTMADGQTAHETVASSTEKEGAIENHEKKIIVENGVSTVPREVSGKGDAGIHDSDLSTDHNHTDAISASETKEVLANGNDSSIKTGGIDHEDIPSRDSLDGKQDRDEETISESAQEKTPKEEVAVKNEDDSITGAEGADSPPEDQKADKAADSDESKSCSPVQVDADKNEEMAAVEKEEIIIERETEECSAEATQVVDDTEEPSDEPNTEAYYTSSFTFVCQKSQVVEKEDEQKWEQAADDASEKVEPQENVETNVTDESVVAVEREIAQQIETTDENNDVSSLPDMNDISKSSFVDAEYSEISETALEGEVEVEYGSELSYERTMTFDFQEANDEAGNLSLTNEKNENESEIDAGVYDNLSTTTDEEKYFPNRTESATPDSDAELRTERIERPTHFPHLKRTGVQKTERPYDSGTTESKIAMEIREMREREEELRLMRERMQSPDSSISSSGSPLLSPTPQKQKSVPSQLNSSSPEPGPGYRVSTVFGHKGSPAPSPVEEEKKTYRSFNKESAVEKEIRIARSREEELRKEKGLPPREDDSYIKPSQVKSSQVRVFTKMNAPNTSKELATTKIQQEIEEQTLREMALREKGHIQTISQERTDSKVAKLKDLDVSVPECASPTSPNGFGGSFSDRSSKRSTPSPTGSSQGLIPPVSRPVSQGKGISMQKFIASKGKETTFITSRNGPSHPDQNADASRSIPVMRKAKRTVSVESKIQQEILELKLREEELRRMHHLSTEQSFLTSGENGTDLGESMNDVSDYVNEDDLNGNDDDLGPSSNSLIAQWEQRIQKAEGRA